MRSTVTLGLATAAFAACLSIAGTQAADAKKGKCVVSGKEIEITDKTPSVMVNSEKLYFCCTNCPKAFAANPEKFVKSAGNCLVDKGGAAMVDPNSRAIVNNNVYYFCCPGCPDAFKNEPAKFVKELKDPVSGKAFAPKASSPKSVVKGQIYLFENAENKGAFEKESAKYVWPYTK